MSQVVVRDGPKLRREIEARSHRFAADEPREVGSDDTAPSPYELLLGSLGACTSMTLQLYAQRQGWKLEAVTVELDHSRQHFDDCVKCADEERRLDRISRRITVSGDLTEEQVARLGQIAARCPIHRTLTGWIEIQDEVARSG